jgi:hypothetical protein
MFKRHKASKLLRQQIAPDCLAQDSQGIELLVLKILLNQVGREARKSPAVAGVFFLDFSRLIRTVEPD